MQLASFVVTLAAIGATSAAALAASAPGPTQRQDDEWVDARPFSIPNARAAQDAREIAQSFLDRTDPSDAIRSLQELVEKHRGKLLAGTPQDQHGRISRELIYPGASSWAERELIARAPALGERYRERFGAEADAALLAAQTSGDRVALIELARRWPLCRAAVHAWWTIGDLELERGHAESAAAAWTRAAQRANEIGLELSAGEQRRAELGAKFGTADSALTKLAGKPTDPGHMRLPGPGDGALDVPRFDAHSWTLPLRREIDPYLPGDTGARCLFPVLDGDTLFVSTGFRLHAIDAFAGELRWVSDAPVGWDSIPAGFSAAKERKLSDFFEAVDYENLLLAPAAADGVVVCAKQIPITQARSQRFQGQFQITKIPPDRRLYAYDTRTGEALWNHRPPEDWDGESGTFVDRMSVAGPPIIVGSRLIAPMYRLQGRVEYHVACFDLFDGSLSWSTNLISGQRELNMFGRHMKEFCAPPLALAGERLIALTQLGTIAALDLFTGDLLWESLYPQEPLPGQAHWQARERDRFWENAPPVVLGDTVLATPIDSREIVALDAQTGLVRWTRSHGEVGLARGTVTALLGCDERSVWLCGDDEIVAGHAPSPLATGGIPETPFRDRASSFLESRRSDRRVARAVLGRRFICVPTNKFRAVLDRHQLQRGKDTLHSSEWRGTERPGNLLLSEGALFVVSSHAVHGFFEWTALERKLRARYESDPQNPDVATRYATLLFHRAQDLWEAGRNREALAALVDGRALIDPLARAARPDRALSQRLFELLRAEAMVLDELAQSSLAVERLATARELAHDRESLCEVYLQEIELLANVKERRWERLLEELDRDCGQLIMPADFLPLRTTSARSNQRVSEPEERLPVGLWTLLQRSERRFDARNAGAELEFLHEILLRYGNVPWPSGIEREGRNLQRTADRIGTLARVTPEAHAPFERAARAALDEALASGTENALDRIVALWPHSRAASEASDALLDAAAQRGDVETIARIVRETLPADWSPRRSSEREAQLMLRLANAIAELNPDCAQGIRVGLAARHPELRSIPGDAESSTLAELARSPRRISRAPSPADRSEFSGLDCEVGSPLKGKFQQVGTLPIDPLEADVQPIVIVRRFDLDDARLYAFTGDNPQDLLWSVDLPAMRSNRKSQDTVFAAGRVLAATTDSVLAFEGASGEEAWDWRVDRLDQRIEGLTTGDGVVVVTVRADRRYLMIGLEASRGLELWRHVLDSELVGRPTIGDGACVFLPTSSSRPALVLDLFAGTRVASIPLGLSAPNPSNVGACWVENGQLILPSFGRSRRVSTGDWIVAFDLDSGQRTWNYGGEPGLEFRAIVQTDAGNFLIGMPTEPGAFGGIVDLDTRFGGKRMVAGTRLRFEDQLLGIARHTRARLDGPLLFVQSSSPGGDLEVLRAIYLPYGERWSHTMTVPREQLYNSLWPVPIVSRNSIAIVYGTSSFGQGPKRRSRLLLLDRSTGEQQDEIDLPQDMSQPASIELAAVGSALLVVSEGKLQFYGRFR